MPRRAAAQHEGRRGEERTGKRYRRRKKRRKVNGNARRRGRKWKRARRESY